MCLERASVLLAEFVGVFGPFESIGLCTDICRAKEHVALLEVSSLESGSGQHARNHAVGVGLASVYA